MARQRFSAVENSFVRGRITEATFLNFPENAVTDEANCVFDETGYVERRLGLDFEENYTDLNLSDVATVREYYWRAVADDGTLSFIVVQYNSTVYFYDTSTEGSISDSRKSFTINLESYKAAGAPSTSEVTCEFASGLGKLFITHPYCDPLYVEYDETSDTISVSSITIETRDFEGLDDGLAIDTRPPTLSTAHRYNLYNQGWYVSGSPLL